MIRRQGFKEAACLEPIRSKIIIIFLCIMIVCVKRCQIVKKMSNTWPMEEVHKKD